MHGINEIKNFNKEHQDAQQILASQKVGEIGRDWVVRQKALNDYLKAKYGNQQNSL